MVTEQESELNLPYLLKPFARVKVTQIMLQYIREREHFLEIFKIQVDDTIQAWVTAGFLCIGGFLYLNTSPFLLIYIHYKFIGFLLGLFFKVTGLL